MYQDARKGLPPLRTQGSPLRSDPILRYRCGLDKPLTSFTPLFKRAIIGLSPKALLLIFLLIPLWRACPGSPGITPHSIMVVQLITSLYEAWPPRELPLCFFCLAGARSPQAGGADSVKPCPTTGGHPKGLGLEGIRGASYALAVPAKQKLVRNLSGTGNKLQIYFLPDHSFDRVLNLPVQPSFKPSDSNGIVYSDMSGGVCYL